MKKRLLALLLLTAVLLCCLSGIRATGALCFVAVNDSIPLSLPEEVSPFYYNQILYIPFTAYDANPAGVTVSRNTNENTLALFTMNRRLVYDLDQSMVTDEAKNTRPFSPVYSNGVLFLPAEHASHFGLTVSLLYSSTGCPILRFTTGEHIYDDALFVERAENFIAHKLEELQQTEGETPAIDPDIPDVQDPDEQLPGTDPASVCVAFAGAAVTQKSLEYLDSNGWKAAFFLTEEQFKTKPELVRAIYASGHTIGITAPTDSTDPVGDLAAANDAMDRVLFCRTLLALLPADSDVSLTGYITVWEPLITPASPEALAVSGQTQLLVCRNDLTPLLDALLESGASLPQLRETTVLPAPVIPEETEEN